MKIHETYSNYISLGLMFIPELFNTARNEYVHHWNQGNTLLRDVSLSASNLAPFSLFYALFLTADLEA